MKKNLPRKIASRRKSLIDTDYMDERKIAVRSANYHFITKICFLSFFFKELSPVLAVAACRTR